MGSHERSLFAVHKRPSSQWLGLASAVWCVCMITLCMVTGTSVSTESTCPLNDPSSCRGDLVDLSLLQTQFDLVNNRRMMHGGHLHPSSSGHARATEHGDGLKQSTKNITLVSTAQASTQHQASRAIFGLTVRALDVVIAVLGTLFFVCGLLILIRKTSAPAAPPNWPMMAVAPPTPVPPAPSFQAKVWDFLEARTPAGSMYQTFTVFLILVTIVCFVLGSLTDTTYNVDPETGQYVGPAWGSWLDFWFFDSEKLGGTSVLEVFVVAFFSADYLLRLWSVVEEPNYKNSRIRYFFTFFSLVDLLSIVPFYVDMALTGTDLPASQFFRTLRLLRMMAYGKYAEVFTLFDDVLVENARLLATSTFVGAVVWVLSAGAYYITERKNPDMIYCPGCPDVNVALCKTTVFGTVSCAPAGCQSECWNLFQSIPSSMYFTLVNLFGEFPLSDRQSSWGKVVATLVAVVAVFVFAIPTGIVGNGFDTLLSRRREAQAAEEHEVPEPNAWQEQVPDGSDTFRGRVFDFLNAKTSAGEWYETFAMTLIVLSVVTFFLETCAGLMAQYTGLYDFLEALELFTVIVFTIEYVARLLTIGEDPKYAGCRGLMSFVFTFFSMIDLLAIVPYWIAISTSASTSSSMFVRSLRLLRLFKSERSMEAFTIFDDVLLAQKDVLLMTGFAAFVLWILFSALMYLTERDNADAEMRGYYKTVPDSMWITLLNLSGECPLCMYSLPGKILTGIMGITAVGFVGIPIGILGAGFQDWVESHQKDTPDQEPPPDPTARSLEDAAEGGSQPAAKKDLQEQVREFVEAETYLGKLFELLIFFLIFVTVVLAIMQTVASLDCDHIKEGTTWCSFCSVFEGVATIIFTIEYALRFFAAESRLEFVFSFYSLVDLLAIVPWYLAVAYPGSWIDDNDDFFRMLRVLRLFKLDKYVPSLTLLDDVFRLKRNALFITGVVAVIIWILFGSLIYLAENNDTANAIDPVPLYGCPVNCTEADRFSNAVTTMPYMMIHLTGDYPIVDYNWFGRIVCMVSVIVAVGVVSIPSGVIADGFKQVVQEKTKLGAMERSSMRAYDIALAALGDTPAPREFQSDTLDSLQVNCNSLLNGTPAPRRGGVSRTLLSQLLFRLLFFLIISSSIVVLVESVPEVAKEASSGLLGLIFSTFETFTVAVFTFEYVLRLFSVTKDKQHLYSRWCYVTTFFGIVDLLAILPWYISLFLGDVSEDTAAVLRMLRLFRLFELEHFVTAFTVLDNVFARSKGVFLASGLMALVIWILSATLYYLFEQNNPNFCTEWSDDACSVQWKPGCTCTLTAFSNVPDCLYFVAIFLAGEWIFTDFTVFGKLLCIFLCLVGIAVYAVPVGTLFDSFGAVLEDGLEALDEDEED